MERQWDMQEVSDGKRYSANDMVRLGCQDCSGCSACCRDMGQSIVLDPYDIYQLEGALGWSFEQMLAKCLELNVVDGIILPNLQMKAGREHCFFLNTEGRCTIHESRPGFCRLFPLGRIYENGSFDYFLQVHECKKTNRSKVKINKWLGIPDLKAYEAFISRWHYYLKDLQKEIRTCGDPQRVKAISMQVLQTFYVQPYDLSTSFYMQFDERLYNKSELSG